MGKPYEQQIVKSWKTNVAPWVRAIDRGEIASRVQVTNQAVIDTVLKLQPRTVLDIGCGEGWLVRALESHHIASLGIDTIAEFIDTARQLGAGRFMRLGYEELSEQTLAETFDALVCNFSLLGDVSVQQVFSQAPRLLTSTGSLLVQTLHPVHACGEQAYQDGWREGSWQGFSEAFSDPAPWYFRTIESWQALFLNNGFKSVEIQEPLFPATKKPASIIFIGRLTD